MGHDHDHGHSHSNSGHSHEHDSHGHSYQNAHDDNNHTTIYMYYIQAFKKYLSDKDFQKIQKLNKEREIFYRFIISCSKPLLLRKKLKKEGILVEKPITCWVENIREFPISKYYYDKILSIPFHNLLKQKQINKVVKAIYNLNNENFN